MSYRRLLDGSNLFSRFSRGSVGEVGLWRLLLLAVLSRLLVFMVAVVSNWFIGVRVGLVEELYNVDVPFLNLFARWDSAFYMNIAKHWYFLGREHWAFLPLFPVVLRVCSYPLCSFLYVDQALVVSGFFANNFLFLLAVAVFYRFTLRLFDDERMAFLSALFLCLYPGGLFFSAIYSESLFMALMLASLYSLELGRWWRAGFFASLASLTKSIGFLLFIPLLFRAVQEAKRGGGLDAASSTAWLAPIFTYLAWMLYGYLMTGDLNLYQHVQAEYWGVGLHDPITAFMSIPPPTRLLIAPVIIVSVLSILVFLAEGGVRLWESCFAPYYLFSAVLLGIFLSYGYLESFTRYSLLLIPVYWFSSRVMVRSEALGYGLMFLYVTLLTVGTVLFANWYKFI